jgi:hypothetical protein
MQATYQKLTVAGNIVEFDTFGKPIFYGTNYRIKHRGPSGQIVSTPEDNENKSAYRAKAMVRRLVNANAFQWFKPNRKPFLPIFITFTFKLDIRNVTEANTLYTDSMQRLNYFVRHEKKHSLHYLTVIEFQDENRSGVVHYHTLFFNMRFIDQVYDEIKRVWKHGNTNIKSVRKVKNFSQYMVKYMIKNLKDGRLKGKKKYFTSRGLLKPKVVYDEQQIAIILKQLPETCKIHTASWPSKYCEKITRVIYDLESNPKALALLNSMVVK